MNEEELQLYKYLNGLISYPFTRDSRNKILEMFSDVLKENEAKEKVIIKQDNILNALEESYIEDIEKLESFGIERQVEIAQIISCYKFYLRRLRELKESDK